MKKISFLLISFFVFASAFGQLTVSDELSQRLNGKTKFYEVKSEVEAYYREKKAALLPADTIQQKKYDKERKKWNRYFYESESRLSPNGEVENAAQRNFDYLTSANFANQQAANLVSVGSWTLVGPTYVDGGIGRINRVAIHPTDPLTMYAGSAGGGLFKTTTGGAAWSNIASYIPSLGVSGIVVSHANANTIYVLTGDGDAFNSGGFTYSFGYIRYSVGILKSTDGGQSFSSTGDLPGSTGTRYVGFNLVQDPNNANTLMATTNRGVYKTTDGGASWVRSDFLTMGNQRRVYDIEYKPGSSSIVYCTARDDNGDCQFYKSTDGGNTFSFISLGASFQGATRIEIAVTPANSSYVYLLAGPGYYKHGDNSDDRFKGLYRSTNSGDNFSLRSNSPDILGYDDILNTFPHQSDYDLALAVSPNDANLVIAGGLVAWSSSDGGQNWSEIIDYFEDNDNSNYIHPDIHHLKFGLLPGVLLAATDGGVAISYSYGSSWTRLYNGLSCSQFYHFEPSNEDGDIWGGTQDNGILTRVGSTGTFDKFDGGDGYDVLTDKAPAGNNNDKYWVLNKEIWADGIVDVNITPSGMDEYFPNLGMSPTNEDVLYAGYSKLFVSYDRGDNWNAISPGSGFTPGNWSMSTCPTNRKRLFAAGSNAMRSGIYRIDNLDDLALDVITDLTPALETAGYPGTHPKITDIAVSENGSNIVWATVGGYNDGQKVFYSTNAGNSWTNISNGLPNLPVNTIVADVNDNIYIGTDIGVYYRAINQSQWQPFYNGLPRVAVSELALAFNTSQVEFNLYAATYGRGIWVSDVTGNCASTLNVTSNQLGQRFYQASSVINSTSLVYGTVGTNVAFRAGTEINLTPGFNAIPGVEFKAYVGDCFSGLPFSRNFVNETGDIVAYKNEIASFKKTGFIENANLVNNELSVEVVLKDTGRFSIRVYDCELKKYIKSIHFVSIESSQKNMIVPLSGKEYSFIRVDLFKDDSIIFMQDARHK